MEIRCTLISLQQKFVKTGLSWDEWDEQVNQSAIDDAEAVYRADIDLWKDNMWGLLGLKLCLEARGDTSGELEKVTSQFNARSSRADIIPAKTCFCAQDSVDDSCC